MSDIDFARRIAALEQQIERLASVESGIGMSARVYRSTAGGVADATAVAVAFEAARWDTGGFWSASATSRVTVPVDGYYDLVGQVIFELNATGERMLRLRVNGNNYIAGENKAAVSGDVTICNVSAHWKATANDYFELVCYQTSGVSLDVFIQDAYGAELSIARRS